VRVTGFDVPAQVAALERQLALRERQVPPLIMCCRRL
jgi:hypothetical protein